MAALDVSFFKPDSVAWPDEIDRLRRLLGAPQNPALFPPHYLTMTLPKIGGHVVMVRRGDQPLGIGFLFPQARQGGHGVYTLRFHRLSSRLEVNPVEITRQVERLLAGGSAEFYDPAAPHSYQGTGWRRPDQDLAIGRPSALEAEAVRSMQQAIWQSDPDYLYPVDIHATSFGAAQSLVARTPGCRPLAGFLFGFHAFAGPALPTIWPFRSDWRLESQLLGVAPNCRTQGIATALKIAQAAACQEAGIEVVHWTFDPLQFGNAVLNLGRLRAVAYTFYPRYYEFRNALNQVPASRLGVTWLIASRRVQQALRPDAATPTHKLEEDSSLQRVNDGWAALDLAATAPQIAIEIPVRWTAMQATAPQEALRWRQAVDQLLAHYVGHEPGRYMITGVGQREGARNYLIARRVDGALLQQLAEEDDL
jgi:predicted GNAT superfamily acetyltransferase